MTSPSRDPSSRNRICGSNCYLLTPPLEYVNKPRVVRIASSSCHSWGIILCSSHNMVLNISLISPAWLSSSLFTSTHGTFYSQLGIITITVAPFPTCILLIRQRRLSDARVSVKLHISHKTENAPCEIFATQLINAVNHENHCMLCQQLMKVCHQIIICSRDRTQLVRTIIDE